MRSELAAVEAAPRVVPDRDFAVVPEVLAAASQIADRLRVGVWLCCPLCRQGIVEQIWDGKRYEMPVEQFEALVLAHLVQRHHWTRELIGDQP